MSRKRSRSPSQHNDQQLYTSAPISDRGSTFLAYFSPASSPEILQSNPDIQSATHRIAAWRRPSRQLSLHPYASSSSSSSSLSPSQKTHTRYDVGHDDDGEKYAGKKLERVLIDMNVQGAVVVARWYGGVLLGPVRFTHIEECARQAIKRCRADQQYEPKTEQGERAKAAKISRPEPVNRERLERILNERDESIKVLRALLAEKRGDAKAEDASQSEKPQIQSSPKLTAYSGIPTDTLKRLEAARDATISFILKEIDKVEKTSSAPGNG